MDAKSSVVVDLDDGSPTLTHHQLQFQDIPHTGMESFDETKTSRSKQQQKSKVQTHTFTNFPHQAESDDEGKQDLLEGGQQKQPSFWTFEYYQAFFDVDTRQVLRRMAGSMLPNPRSNYLQLHIRPRPDLYGPFWICTTLVFTTAIAGNIANYLRYHDYKTEYEWKYDFHKVTFSASAIFAYWWLMPTVLYGLLWWRGNKAGLAYTELLCVYGYSLAIYIPISILWMIQWSWLQWLLVLIGMALSGSVLVLTLFPVFRDDTKPIVIGAMALVIILHGLLAVGFMLYFFHVPSVESSSDSSPTTTVMSSVTLMPVSNVGTTSQIFTASKP